MLASGVGNAAFTCPGPNLPVPNVPASRKAQIVVQRSRLLRPRSRSIMSFPPCRYFGLPEIEDRFCEACLEPCSSAAVIVGPHTGHRTMEIWTGITDGSILHVMESEAASFVTALQQNVESTRHTVSLAELTISAAVSATRLVDDQIEALNAQKIRHMAEISSARDTLRRSLEKNCEKMVQLLRIGRHTIDHTLRHSLEVQLLATASGRDLFAQLHHHAHATTVAVANCTETLLSILNEQTPAATVWTDVVKDAAAWARATGTVRFVDESKTSPSEDSESADDDANWCFHRRCRSKTVAFHARSRGVSITSLYPEQQPASTALSHAT
jgi:hypothetical protein